ncbi:BON domain-containing protein [Thermochromatium tepidum]|uniref:BON domain-containing protein n=1 Tax=Thermochromatium tepidum TaxID=1050 RepID=UPI001FEB006F|nr:BON domain-containing protein [Thermochromatium tepidum]
MKPITLAGVILVSALSAAGCAPLVVGGAAVVGASAIHDRRPTQAILDDRYIELAAAQAIFQDRELRDGARLVVTSYNRSVLLTGQAESAALARRAAERISRLPRVARVIDEVRVGPRIGMSRQSEDAYIASRAKLELAGIELPDFDPTRVKIVVEDGVLYLLGLVTPREADLVAERVRYVPGVRTVVKLFEYWTPNA